MKVANNMHRARTGTNPIMPLEMVRSYGGRRYGTVSGAKPASSSASSVEAKPLHALYPSASSLRLPVSLAEFCVEWSLPPEEMTGSNEAQNVCERIRSR